MGKQKSPPLAMSSQSMCDKRFNPTHVKLPHTWINGCNAHLADVQIKIPQKQFVPYHSETQQPQFWQFVTNRPLFAVWCNLSVTLNVTLIPNVVFLMLNCITSCDIIPSISCHSCISNVWHSFCCLFHVMQCTIYPTRSGLITDPWPGTDAPQCHGTSCR